MKNWQTCGSAYGGSAMWTNPGKQVCRKVVGRLFVAVDNSGRFALSREAENRK